MAYRESAYERALDAIQQRDNEMAGEWLDMAKLTQYYIMLLTQYLEQQPLQVVNIDVDFFEAPEGDFDHLAEPALEEWSHMADLGLDEEVLPECPSGATKWPIDYKIIKTYVQKHVEESREDDYYDNLIIVDIAAKFGTLGPPDDQRDPVSYQESLTQASSSKWGSSSSSMDLKSSRAFELPESSAELPTAGGPENVSLASPFSRRSSPFSKRTRRPSNSKRSSLSWPFAF